MKLAIRQAGHGILLSAAAMLAGTGAHAQMAPGFPDAVTAYDAREVGMLPRFCLHTQDFREHAAGGNDPAQIERWSAFFGPTYWHLHHYCWGLMKTNRAMLLVRNVDFKRSYLADAIKEFDYVIERAPADFVLLPEILTKKGENLVRLGRGPHALLEFERAAELKPDYWPPYAQLSDYYKSSGDIAKAREQLRRGLSFAPDATALQRRLSELDRPEGRSISR